MFATVQNNSLLFLKHRHFARQKLFFDRQSFVLKVKLDNY